MLDNAADPTAAMVNPAIIIKALNFSRFILDPPVE
jgi:hypothetical protein